MTDPVGNALRAQEVYERLDAVVQALGALKQAIDAMITVPPETDDD